MTLNGLQGDLDGPDSALALRKEEIVTLILHQWIVRLSVRSPYFQFGKAGSIPAQSSIAHVPLSTKR